MSKISVLSVIPGRSPEIREMENDLENFQHFVDGFIECVTLENGDVLVCNEEGRLRGMEDNRVVEAYGMIKGPFIICGEMNGDFVSVSMDTAQKWDVAYPERQETASVANCQP